MQFYLTTCLLRGQTDPDDPDGSWTRRAVGTDNARHRLLKKSNSQSLATGVDRATCCELPNYGTMRDAERSH